MAFSINATQVFKWKDNNLSEGLDKLQKKMTIAVLMYASTKASQIESYMKNNRPWTDRTGIAKSTLSARASLVNPSLVRIAVAHGVDYGIWLELAHEKNYAILGPTINVMGPKIVEDMQSLMDKI